MLASREHILSEIKRTATANGGVPLGSKRFEAESGLRTSDWCGRFWARWGDALQEAGFAPNQMNRAYDDTDLLAKYVALAHFAQRLPTSRDLQLKHRESADYPDHKVFERLGNKQTLIGRALAYCRGQGNFADVAEMCESYLQGIGEAGSAGAQTAGLIGYVYLIKHGVRREFKIGSTNNPLRRQGEIAIELPERVSPVHVIETDDAPGIEAYWHQRFAQKRKNGEWFALSNEDVRAFKRRRFM